MPEVKGRNRGAQLQASRDLQKPVPQRACDVYRTGLCCYAEELEQLNAGEGMRYMRLQGSSWAMRQSYPAHHGPSVQSAVLLPQELVQLNVLKGMKDTLVSKELMGRAAIPLRPFTDKAGEPVDMWVDLGKGEWANEDGTVRPEPSNTLPYPT